jgi:hypothetical protein
LPNESTTVELGPTIEESLGELPVSIVEAGDALIVTWETAGLSLRQVASHLVGDDAQTAEFAEKLQTRRDVAWTEL